MKALAVVAPADLAALQTVLSDSAGRVHFVAGGTDLLIAGRRLPQTGLLVDVSRVDGMAFIDSRGGDIRIGAATTAASLAADQGLRARLAALSEAAAQCGSVQIRNRATIGGNIANAAPAADLVPVLLAAGARLALLGQDGTRYEVALSKYAPTSGSLILEVILPRRGLLPRSAFVKLGSRRDMTISRLNLAMLAEFQNDRFGLVRIAAGALGPAARRLHLAEMALVGRKLDATALRGFISVLVGEVDTAIPGRNSQPYKRRAVAGLGLDLIAQAVGLSPRDRLFEEAAE